VHNNHLNLRFVQMQATAMASSMTNTTAVAEGAEYADASLIFGQQPVSIS
jgi:hypothetical protein